jgi:hypothetical protein
VGGVSRRPGTGADTRRWRHGATFSQHRLPSPVRGCAVGRAYFVVASPGASLAASFFIGAACPAVFTGAIRC